MMTTNTKALALPKQNLLQHPRLLLQFKHQPLQTLRQICDRYGDLVNFEIGSRNITLVRDPEYIEQILVKKRKHFTKDTPAYQNLKLLLGEGLITSEGDFWTKQRRIAQPSFHQEKIAGFAQVMTGVAEEIVTDWQSLAKQARIDVAAEMQKATLKIMGLALLSIDLSDETQAVSQALPIVLKYIAEQTQPVRFLPSWLPTGEKHHFQNAIAQFDQVVYNIIARRRQQKKPGEDLLGMFLETYDEETGEKMSDRQLRDEVMTMFLAGHETSSASLSWTFYLLTQHPQIEADLRSELQQVLGDCLPNLADLPKLELLDRVIKESMRIYPPIPLIGRKVEVDQVLGNYYFPAGMQVIVSSYLTHRHPKFWVDSDRFDPDRFLPECFEALPKLAYFPFGDGSRKCIGDQFALMEIKLILATILQRFKLSLAGGQQVEMDVNLTLRPKGGLPMSLQLIKK
jgi:cytochrome P450